MNISIEWLLKISSPRLGDDLIVADPELLLRFGELGKQLDELLRLRNGFYAFEGALHVFPAESSGRRSLEEWNRAELWRFEYGDLSDGKLFFAEDAFGNQFCIEKQSIMFFDSETGETKALADSLKDWIELVLEDYEFQTGYPLMHEWQNNNGRIPEAYRIVPRIPFVLGGEYSIRNLVAMDSACAMRARGNIARQIQSVPDGAHVEVRLDDYPFRRKL